MERSQNTELAKRINQAYALLNKDRSQSQVVEHLIKRYGVSQIQAYRYVQQAKEMTGKISVEFKTEGGKVIKGEDTILF